jgi:hypothetical protein
MRWKFRELSKGWKILSFKRKAPVSDGDPASYFR